MGISLVSVVKSLVPRKGSFAANVLTLMTGTGLAQGLTIAALPILTRLYTPEDFGTLAVFLSIILLLVAVASWRYEWAIPLPEDRVTAANLLGLCLLILVGMTLLAGLGLLFLLDLVVQLVKTPMLKPYLWLLPFGLLGAGTYQVLNYWATRKKAFGAITRTKLSQSLGQVLTQLGLGFLSSGPLGLLLGGIIGQTSGCTTLASLVWRQDGDVLKKISILEMRKAAYRYRRFPLVSSVSSLLNTAGLQVPMLLLAAFYGPQVVGWFLLGQRVIGWPIRLLTQATSSVFFAEAARLVHEDQRALQRIFYNTALKLLLIALPIGLIALFGPWLIPLVFGKMWREAGVYTQLLTLMFITQTVVSPISLNLTVLELQHWQLFWDAGQLLVVIGSLMAAHSLVLLPATCIFIYAMAMSFALITLFFINVCALRRRIRRG